MPQQFCKLAIINKQEYWTGFSGKTLLVNVDLVRKCFCISIIHSNIQVTKNCIRSLRKVKKNEIPLASRNQSVRIKPRDKEWWGFWEQFQPRPRGMRRWGESFGDRLSYHLSWEPNSVTVTCKLCVTVAKSLTWFHDYQPSFYRGGKWGTKNWSSMSTVTGWAKASKVCNRTQTRSLTPNSSCQLTTPRAAFPEQGSPVLVLKWMPRGFRSSMGKWEKCIKEVNFL